jgi:FeS assembly protein IscX
MSESLNWDSTYAVALALRRAHPRIDLDQVSLGQVYAWTVALPGFDDDPALANDRILADIYQDWLEETLDDKQ